MDHEIFNVRFLNQKKEDWIVVQEDYIIIILFQEMYSSKNYKI